MEKVRQRKHEVSCKNMESLFYISLSVAVENSAFEDKKLFNKDCSSSSISRQSSKCDFLVSGTDKISRKPAVGFLHPTYCFHRKSIFCPYLVPTLLVPEVSGSKKSCKGILNKTSVKILFIMQDQRQSSMSFSMDYNLIIYSGQ